MRSIAKRAQRTTVIYVDPGTGKFINANAILRDLWLVAKGKEIYRERTEGIRQFLELVTKILVLVYDV